MPKYSIEQIFGLLKEIEAITLEIRRILDEKPNVSKNLIAALSERYSKRKKLLLTVNIWSKSEEGALFIKNNSELWFSNVSKILDKDKIIIKDIKNYVDNLNIELKKLMKNKNVLIYTKVKRT